MTLGCVAARVDVRRSRQGSALHTTPEADEDEAAAAAAARRETYAVCNVIVARVDRGDVTVDRAQRRRGSVVAAR